MVGEIHRALCSQALDAVKASKDLPVRALYVCKVCGNTVYDAAPDKCPICGAPKAQFFEVG
jgi:rubrerythrin